MFTCLDWRPTEYKAMLTALREHAHRLGELRGGVLHDVALVQNHVIPLTARPFVAREFVDAVRH